MHRITAAIWMDLVPCLCTALGAGTVFLTGRRTAGPGRGAMGLSAGIMLGAGLFGLLLPAAEAGGWPAALAGFSLGAAALAALGPVAGRVTRKGGAAGLVLASAFYNLPQGMAVGLAGATAAQGAGLAGALTFSLGLGLQNFPEGAALSLPLRAKGASRRMAFGAGAASGLVELAGAALAGALAVRLAPALPWLMGGAAGAMACTVARQLAPAALGEGGRGAAGAALGFGAMFALSTLLG